MRKEKKEINILEKERKKERKKNIHAKKKERQIEGRENIIKNEGKIKKNERN